MDRIQGHSVRRARRRGEDHHQPPGEVQRLHGGDLRGADRRVPPRRLRQVGGGDRARQRRRQGVLHRRRPERARGRLRGPRHHRAADRRVAVAHSRRAEAGDRPRAGLRHRRRQRAGDLVRPDDRVGEGGVRAGRARRSARSIRASAPPIWRGSSARSGRGRSGTCAAAIRRKRPTTWAWSTPWCRPTSSTKRSTSGAPRFASKARPPSPSPSARSTPTARHLRAIGALGFEALALFYGTEESKEGGRAFREKRKPEFRSKKK